MSSTDHSSTTYDIIFVGGMLLLLYLSDSCADNRVRRSGCLRHCRSSCRGWSFLEDSGECQEILVHQYFSWFILTQIVEAGPHTRDEPNHVQPARCFRSLMRPTETFTFHVAKPSPALLDRSLVVPTGRALGGGSSVNCRKFIFVVDAQTEIVISCLLHKGGSLRLRRLGKRIWEWRMEFWTFDTTSQKS